MKTLLFSVTKEENIEKQMAKKICLSSCVLYSVLLYCFCKTSAL